MCHSLLAPENKNRAMQAVVSQTSCSTPGRQAQAARISRAEHGCAPLAEQLLEQQLLLFKLQQLLTNPCFGQCQLQQCQLQQFIRVHHSPCGKYGLACSRLALITSGCGIKSLSRAHPCFGQCMVQHREEKARVTLSEARVTLSEVQGQPAARQPIFSAWTVMHSKALRGLPAVQRLRA